VLRKAFVVILLRVVVDRDVAIPMRDGIVLRADVYRPAGARRVPAILHRTPYNRAFRLTPPAAVDPERAVEAGFAFVCQDVRGLHGSDGEFTPFRTEGDDGHDTIAWIAAQPWCSGAVGMAGRSYAATTQWLAAAQGPPALRAIAPVVTGSHYYYGWVYQGGAFQLGFNLFWMQLMRGGKARPPLKEQFARLPLTEAPLVRESDLGRSYREWLSHPTEDEYWTALAINRRYPQVHVPAFNVGGWYDLFLRGTLENFRRLREEGGSHRARSGSRLLVGPWSHGSTYGPYPDHQFDLFGGHDTVDLADRQLRFFAHHLSDDGLDEPPVRLFVMGANRWRDEDAWPLARAREQRWFLRDGRGLSPEAPGAEPHDSYVYDPADPAPTIGGPTSLPGRFLRTNSGPLDQREIERRGDVLVYTSAPLDAPLEATGPLGFVLYAATSARDTDFVVKLCDVAPDGASHILAEGVLRARFRDGFDRARLVEPGSVQAYRIDLVATSNVFAAGHRIRVAVTSSSFPRFDRNLNTGGSVGAERAEDLVTARQTIFHDAERPSHLVLPIVES
jgi:uncharacterized protein